MDGIDAVSVSGTVTVDDGTYFEHVKIKKPLTLQAGSTPIIDGGGSGVGIDLASSDVTIQGMTITNCGSGIQGYLVSSEYTISPGYQNIHLVDNTIYNMNNGVWGFGIYLGTESERYNPADPIPGLYDPWLVSNGLLDFTGLEINGNEIYDTSGACITLQSMYPATGIIDVYDNYIHDGDASCIWIDSSEDLLIEENTLENCGTGVFISAYSDGWYEGTPNQPFDSKNINIIGNDIYGNYLYGGVSVYDGYPGLITINYNNIVGNAPNGVYNYLSEDVDATCNWWGDSSGPSGNGPGTGDSVSTYVTFCPWSTASYPGGDCDGGAVCRNVEDDITFCSIQAAIDASTTSNGETIEVFAGTHPGNIIVYKELTIQSQSGAASTIIDASSVDYSSYQNAWGHGINYAWAETWDPGLLRNGFCIWNDTVTIDGFSIINANYPSSYNRGIGVLIGSIHTTYAGHVPWNIDQWGGIVPSPDEPTPTGVLIKNNIIDGASDGIYNWASNGNTIEYNTISNTDPLGGTGIQCYEGGTDNIIRGNNIDNAVDAICVAGAWPDVLLDVSGTLVTENILTNNNNVGIKFYNVAGSGVIASYNDIFDNAKGISIEGAGGALVATAYCNNIVGNTIGVENGVSDGTFNAECNWWGDCSGPSGQGPGTGDSVSTNVDFTPWLGLVIADVGGLLYEDTDCDDDYTIAFDGSASFANSCCGGETLTYDWDFGDGSAHGTGVSPTHTYGIFGEYTVTLTVTGSVYGCTDTSTAMVKIYGVIADANGPYNIPEDTFTVHFDGSGSTGYELPLTYDWDFGDGTGWHNGIGATPSYTYAMAGTYDVTLRVTESGNGCFDTDTATVHIGGEDPPIIQIIYPEDGDTINGVFTVRWFAVDDDYPQGIGIPIYLYYRPAGAYVTDIRLIADGLTNNIDMFTGEYDWDTSSLSDGDYVLIAETHDLNMNIVHDTVEITVGNGNAGTMVSDVLITDTTIDSYNWVKDGDTVEVTAGITGATTESTTITADLSGFGMGTNVEADFDGFTATWTLNNVVCTPSDGTITVTVTVNEIHSNSATITADNTAPEMVIEKPVNGLYFFNGKLLPFSRTIIIGPIDIEVEGSSDVAKAEFYIDDELMKTVTGSTPEWYMNIKLRGQHNLEIIVYDGAGNTVTESKMITVYNFFGN
jgi:parallel beta-helix repeat protein